MTNTISEKIYIDFYYKIFLIFFCLSPYTLIFNGITDILISFIGILGLYYLYKIKFFLKIVFKIQYLIPLAFYFYIVLNSYYSSEDINLSAKSSIVYIRFIIFYFILSELLKNEKFRNKLFGSIKFILIFWLIAGIFISSDILFQFYTEYSLFGHKSTDNRLSGPFEELLAGKYLSNFFLLLSVIPLLYLKVRFFLILFYIFFLSIIILITGERMAFINTIFLIVLFIFFDNNYLTKKKKLLIIFLFFFVFATAMSFNKDLFDRNVTQTINQILGKTNVSADKKYFLDHYGILFKTAIEITKRDPIFGTGQKTFRNECSKNNYEFIERVELRCSTHPHNYLLEILSENGLIGLFLIASTLFIIIKSNLRYELLMHRYILFQLIVFLNPLQITGRFTNTWISSSMWILIYFMILFSYYENNQKSK